MTKRSSGQSSTGLTSNLDDLDINDFPIKSLDEMKKLLCEEIPKFVDQSKLKEYEKLVSNILSSNDFNSLSSDFNITEISSHMESVNKKKKEDKEQNAEENKEKKKEEFRQLLHDNIADRPKVVESMDYVNDKNPFSESELRKQLVMALENEKHLSNSNIRNKIFIGRLLYFYRREIPDVGDLLIYLKEKGIKMSKTEFYFAYNLFIKTSTYPRIGFLQISLRDLKTKWKLFCEIIDDDKDFWKL